MSILPFEADPTLGKNLAPLSRVLCVLVLFCSILTLLSVLRSLLGCGLLGGDFQL